MKPEVTLDTLLLLEGRRLAAETVLVKLLERLVRAGLFSYDDLQMLFADPPEASAHASDPLHQVLSEAMRVGFDEQNKHYQTVLLPKLLRLLPNQEVSKKDS